MPFEIVQVQSSALPTGAATEATLASIDAGIPVSLGQKPMAGSMSVAIASDQPAVTVSAAALPLPAGAATEATLAAASAKLPASLGAKTSAASLSVVLASDDVINADSTPVPDSTQGASSLFYRASTASTNSALIKGSNANINTIVVANVRNSNVFLKLYNKATAPVVGTDTPALTIVIPANQTVSVPCGPFGIRFPLGLGMGLTTGIPVNNTGAVAADDAHVSISYT